MPDEFSDDDVDEIDELPVRKRREPEIPVEVASSPLYAELGSGKLSAIAYSKVVRLDGAQGERGYQGTLPGDATLEDLRTAYGSGTFRCSACNLKNKVLGTVTHEIAERASREPHPAPSNGATATGAPMLHVFKMLSDQSQRHEAQTRDASDSATGHVSTMADRSLAMVTSVMESMRASESAAHATSLAQQQQFFVAMFHMMSTQHAQQIAMYERSRESERASQAPAQNPLELFLQGVQLAGSLGGGGGSEEPEYLKVLQQGGAMLGHLATLAGAAPGLGQKPVLPGMPAPKGLPSPVGTENPEPKAAGRKLPFTREEIRELAKLKATLKKRGVPLGQFLDHSSQHIATLPDSNTFEDDGADNEGSENAGQDHAPRSGGRTATP
jgi:hypothetical protein